MEAIAKEVFQLIPVAMLRGVFLAAASDAAAWLKESFNSYQENATAEASDTENVKEIQKSFLKIIKENDGIIQKVCYAYIQNYTEREDLFQEIVLQLWKSYRTFKGNSKISTWMFGVALRSAIMPYRRNSRIEYRDTLPDLPADEKLEWIDDRLYNLFQKLPNYERAIAALMMEGYNYKEIGTVLRMEEATVRQRMSRVRKMFEKELKK